MTTEEQLDARIKKLEEKKSFRELLVGSLLGPVLVAMVAGFGGLYVTRIQTATQARLDETTKQIERMKVAQQMVADLFSDNHGRSLATEQILTRVLDDPALVTVIHDLVQQYYEGKVAREIGAGNLQAAYAIVDNARQIDSPTAKAIVKAAELAHPQELEKGKSYQSASVAEAEGFQALTQGDLNQATMAFDRAKKLAPDYHDVSEISGVLHRAGAGDAATKQAATREIVNKYSWKMPEGVKAQLRQQSAPPAN